jgi:hypothetical protein
MPPGDYFAVAIDDIDGESTRDPDTLALLARGATRVRLTDAGPIDLNLRRYKLQDLLGR